MLTVRGHTISAQALYLSSIWGLTIFDEAILNITGVDGLNIYYLASAFGNDYLAGLDYGLTGGGQLLAIGTYTGGSEPVPEPATIALLGIGLLGLALFRRMKKVA